MYVLAFVLFQISLSSMSDICWIICCVFVCVGVCLFSYLYVALFFHFHVYFFS